MTYFVSENIQTPRPNEFINERIANDYKGP